MQFHPGIACKDLVSFVRMCPGVGLMRRRMERLGKCIDIRKIPTICDELHDLLVLPKLVMSTPVGNCLPTYR